MTKKKTDEFEVAMDAAVENNEEMEDVADDVSDAILEELSMYPREAFYLTWLNITNLKTPTLD